MPADTDLPPEAKPALGEYLAALDAALPGLARGIYATGSAVLGDWRPGRSDLDILTVTERALDDAELTALEALHAGIPDRPYRDAIYIPAAAVGSRPDEDDAGTAADDWYPSAIDGVFQRSRYRPDPVLWATLHRRGLSVRGARADSLGAEPGADWLREWNHANLETYWRPWAAKARTVLQGHEADEPLDGYTVAWGALGPGRLHATITTGEIISKTAAGEYTAALLPQYADLVARAKRYRLGDDSLAFTMADGLLTCDLVDAVADDAAGLKA